MSQTSSPTEFYFDAAAADRVVRFFRDGLRHVKGRWAGTRFELLPWQEKITRDIFGWKRKDGTRRYRTAFVEVPRKQGKSTWAGGIALYLECADGEKGAEVYSAAADREQAAIVFQTARSMVESSPSLSSELKRFRSSIVYERTASTYKVLSADAPTKHGLNPHGIIFDELHTQRTRELWDTLTTAQGARSQPLVLAITTAGYDFESVCREVYEYACGVRDGVIEDPSFYPCIFEAEEEDDWRDPAVWAKANPSFGVTVTREFLEQEALKADHSLAYQNTFRRLYLNQWTRQRDRFLDLDAWDACGAPLGDLAGRRAWAGLDLANVTDINAFVLVFEPDENDVLDVLPHFFVPEDRIEQRAARDRVPYDAWVRAGFIETTPGNVADHRQIKRRICEIRDEHAFEEVAFDRWGSVQISADLQDEGITMVEFGQGFGSMAAPTKELLKLVLAGKIRHGGNPVLRWMADNVVAKQDEAGNLKPDKMRSPEKIDGIVALIMGLSRALLHVDTDTGPSVYEERGMVAL